MRLAMLVRSDNRGLGNLTWEAWRHLRPSKVLIVKMGPAMTPYEERHEHRYGDTALGTWPQEMRFGRFDGHRLEDEALDFITTDVDVLYTAETPYDHRLFSIARERGVRTVLHGMYEFLRWNSEPDLPRPDLFLAPSDWHYDRWPEPKALMQFPVARDRLPFRRRERAQRFLHVAGHPARGDRNGTQALLDALPMVRTRTALTIRSQSPLRGVRSTAFVDVEVETGDIEDYWDLYRGTDVLIAPRRYGGLSLPMQEAASLGMPVITTAMHPQASMFPPECLVQIGRTAPMRTPGGPVERAEIPSQRLAHTIERFARDDALVAEMSDASGALAARIGWEAALEPFLALLAG